MEIEGREVDNSKIERHGRGREIQRQKVRERNRKKVRYREREINGEEKKGG